MTTTVVWPSATELFVVPGGALLRLPFTVLPWNGSPLGEALPITVLPSASALCAGSDRTHRSERPLVVGDPAGMTYSGAAPFVPISSGG